MVETIEITVDILHEIGEVKIDGVYCGRFHIISKRVHRPGKLLFITDHTLKRVSDKRDPEDPTGIKESPPERGTD